MYLARRRYKSCADRAVFGVCILIWNLQRGLFDMSKNWLRRTAAKLFRSKDTPRSRTVDLQRQQVEFSKQLKSATRLDDKAVERMVASGLEVSLGQYRLRADRRSFMTAGFGWISVLYVTPPLVCNYVGLGKVFEPDFEQFPGWTCKHCGTASIMLPGIEDQKKILQLAGATQAERAVTEAGLAATRWAAECSAATVELATTRRIFLDLTEREASTLEELARLLELPTERVLIQALRTYQAKLAYQVQLYPVEQLPLMWTADRGE